MSAPESRTRPRWSSAWLDAVAFAAGLALAWCFDWSTTDLIWSLWLSSLVVGYAMIVNSITRPLREFGGNVARDRAGVPPLVGAGLGVAFVFGTLFMLAFFTVHFGGFHFVHSAFLAMFFPLDGVRPHGFPTLSLYAEVFRRYWWFLPSAFLAERAAFRARPRPDSDTAVTPEAIKARLGRSDEMMAPYRNVVRMHLLIFFFAFAHFVHLASFAVYAVAYAVYFFPWRLLKRGEPTDRATD